VAAANSLHKTRTPTATAHKHRQTWTTLDFLKNTLQSNYAAE